MVCRFLSFLWKSLHSTKKKISLFNKKTLEERCELFNILLFSVLNKVLLMYHKLQPQINTSWVPGVLSKVTHEVWITTKTEHNLSGLSLMIKTECMVNNSEMVFKQIFDNTWSYSHGGFAPATSRGTYGAFLKWFNPKELSEKRQFSASLCLHL